MVNHRADRCCRKLDNKFGRRHGINFQVASQKVQNLLIAKLEKQVMD
jgi:hypothetical protein